MRLAALAALALAACAAHAAPPPPSNTGGTPATHELVASISRTACYGTCPIYTLEVYRDGVVEYVGEQFVKIEGKRTGHVTPAQIAEIDRLFTAGGYFDLKDGYTNEDWTDMPSAHTSYSAGGRTKSIGHYYGDNDAPPKLTEMEEGLDRIVGIEQWIGTREEREHMRM